MQLCHVHSTPALLAVKHRPAAGYNLLLNSKKLALACKHSLNSYHILRKQAQQRQTQGDKDDSVPWPLHPILISPPHAQTDPYLSY